MKTSDVVFALNLLAREKGNQATFSNKKWKSEIDLENKDQSEIRKLANKSFAIETKEGTYTRPTITAEWEFTPTKLNKKIKKVEEELDIPADFMEDSLEDELDKALNGKRRKARRSGRRAKGHGGGAEAVVKPAKARRAKRKEPKEPGAKGETQGAFITECLVAGMGNKETYEAMLKHFGSGVITEKHKTHPAWYRWKLKKQGLLAQ